TLAIGNRFVFRDIGLAMVRFLEWYERTERQHPDEKQWEHEWERFRRTITGGRSGPLFQDAEADTLRNGFEQYFLAIRADDADARREHVLHGNVLLAVYEQWRLDPIIRLALDPLAANLVTFRLEKPRHGSDEEHDGERLHAVLRNRGTPWATQQRSLVY